MTTLAVRFVFTPRIGRIRDELVDDPGEWTRRRRSIAA
jgi:hypothetical protein